jgi:hypothetical protein
MTNINLWLFLAGRAGFKVYLPLGADVASVYLGIFAQNFHINLDTFISTLTALQTTLLKLKLHSRSTIITVI